MSTTEELAQLISQTEFEAIPPEVVDVAKIVIPIDNGRSIE